MIENPCLRPACLSDVADQLVMEDGEYWIAKTGRREDHNEKCAAGEHLEALYMVEWKLRGFERSP